MRIGTMIGADGANNTLDDIVNVAKRAEAAGLDNVWLANIFGFCIGRDGRLHSTRAIMRRNTRCDSFGCFNG